MSEIEKIIITRNTGANCINKTVREVVNASHHRFTVLHFIDDSFMILLHDGSGIVENELLSAYIRCWPLVEMKIATDHQYRKLMEEWSVDDRKKSAEARRATYEQLKKEFEGSQ
jgi:hypothetical protein